MTVHTHGVSASTDIAVANALEAIRLVGYAVIPSVLDERFVAEITASMHRAHARIVAEVGHERLERAGEMGVLRAMMRYDATFFRLLEQPEVLALVDATVGEHAILHLQNGFILPSHSPEATPRVFQNVFHRDFPRYLNGYVASVNVMVAIDPFTADNGATLVVPGSHRQPDRPETAYMERSAIPVTCPAGSLVAFDSTLWHAAGQNTSGAERLAINHQFTRSWIKQQIDYVRTLGDETMLGLPPRTQQILGWYTRVVTSLDEYYQPQERRLYRSGQG